LENNQQEPNSKALSGKNTDDN